MDELHEPVISDRLSLHLRALAITGAGSGPRLATGSTALLSLHVVTDVEDACDRIAIMGTREIGFQSSDSPKSEFVRRSGSAEN